MNAYELFAGCGGAGVGIKMAGYKLTGGIEYHTAAANIYDANHQVPLTRANILDIDHIPTVNITWASPPCQKFSLANNNRGETEKEIYLAKHIAKLMVNSQPCSIAIENVRGYWNSDSCNILLDKLSQAGYNIEHSIECAANYGAATTRQRLIVRASLNPILPLVRTHQKPPSLKHQLSLFDTLPSWVNWYTAIEHFISTLPKSTLTDKQLASLSAKNIDYLPWIDRDGREDSLSSAINQASNLLPAITALDSNYLSQILVERVGYRKRTPKVYRGNVPCPTIRSATHIDDKGSYRVAANIVDVNLHHCYAANIRALAAWQSFPDNYQWLGNRGEAGKAIGNSVPPLLSAAIVKSFT